MIHPKTPFSKNDLNLDPQDLDFVLSDMIDKGLITSFVKNGEVYYQLTEIGYAVGCHLTSDPKMAN